MSKKITIIVSCLVLFLFSGCVSQDKYRKLEIEHSKTEQQMKEDKKALFALQVQNIKLFQKMELASENQRLQKTIDELKLELNNEKSVEAQTEKTASKTTPSTDELSSPYSILLSSCQLQESVQKVLSDYKEKNLEPFVVKVDLGEKAVWWRIFTGHFETRESAIDEMNKSGLADKIILKTTQADPMFAHDAQSEPVNNNTVIAHDEENESGNNNPVLANDEEIEPVNNNSLLVKKEL